MRKIIFPLTMISAWLLLFSLAFAFPALAQSGQTLSLRLNKDMGFSDLGGARVQGTFSLSASGPDNLAKVVFYLDGQVIGEDSEAPFKIQFITDRYPIGQHNLSAKGTTMDGNELDSNVITTNFISSSDAGSYTLKILVPILGAVVLVALASTLGPVLLRKGKNVSLPPGSQRTYGISGGTICPRCQRPFSISPFGMNLVMGKLSRCPYCGKWFLARRYPIEMLRAAEQAELADVQATSEQIPEETEEEKLRREIDNSRYMGS